jgi:hypothetical protein
MIVTPFLTKFGALNHNFAALHAIGFFMEITGPSNRRDWQTRCIRPCLQTRCGADLETLVMYHNFHLGLRVIRE